MLTPEEHTARAMLMGRTYIEYLSIYVIHEEWMSQTPKTESWLDADTLEEVPGNERLDRIGRGIWHDTKTHT